MTVIVCLHFGHQLVRFIGLNSVLELGSPSQPSHHPRVPYHASDEQLGALISGTSGLDATVQIQILLLLRQLQRDLGMGVIFVTHDIGVAVEVSDPLAVMYAGQIETGTVRELLKNPRHPYTWSPRRGPARREEGRVTGSHPPARRRR